MHRLVSVASAEYPNGVVVNPRLPVLLHRLIAVLGIFALAVTYLPSVVNGSSFDGNTAACCNGAMCPMHHAAGNSAYCDMDGSHKQSTLQSCPDYGVHYAAALTFVRVAAPVFFTERVVEHAADFIPHVHPNAYIGVMSPPPRVSLA